MSADSDGVKRLHQIERLLQLLQRMLRILRYFFQGGLKKAELIDVADNKLSGFSLSFRHFPGIELFEKVLLKRLLAGYGVKKELPPFLVLRISRRVTDILRHVIAPFFVEFR